MDRDGIVQDVKPKLIFRRRAKVLDNNEECARN